MKKGILKTVDGVVGGVERKVDDIIPVLFTLLVTFGLVATLRGFELVLMRFASLYDNPWLLLTIGMSILIVTGTLYKKLG
jgi:hypothetical protein